MSSLLESDSSYDEAELEAQGLSSAINASLRDERGDSAEDDTAAIQNAVDAVVGDSGSDELPKEFICAICLEMVFHPTTLLCQHTFCLDCVKTLQEKSKHKCPECNQKFPFPAEYNRVLDDAVRRMFPEVYQSRQLKHDVLDKAKTMDAKIRDELYRALLPEEVNARPAEPAPSRVETTSGHPFIPPSATRYAIWEMAVPSTISEDDVMWYLNSGRSYKHLCTFAVMAVGSVVAEKLCRWLLPESVGRSAGDMVQYSGCLVGGLIAASAYTRYSKFDQYSNQILQRPTGRILTQAGEPINPLQILSQIMGIRHRE